MKEKEFIQIIKNTLNSKYIGDDCAYLRDLGILITQDNLVEDVHFSMEYTTPFELGYKSAMVNISDICASGAKPLYLTIGLSLPSSIENNFIEKFYGGLKAACKGVEVVGGDITGGDKIFVSVTAIGSSKDRKISSRSNAKNGYKVIVSGLHGSSAAGLKLLKLGVLDKENKFIKAHLMPEAQIKFSKDVASKINEDYAMMDTSDGLMDALLQIAVSSNVTLDVDFEKIPYDRDIEKFNNWKDLILYGGEDYGLVAAVPNWLLKNLYDYKIIGEVQNGKAGVNLDGKFYSDASSKLFNHFKE